MNDTLKEAILAAVESRTDWTVGLLQDMLRVPSVNPWFEDDDSRYGEAAYQQWLAGVLTGLGANEVDLWEPVANQLAHLSDGPGYYEGRDFTGRPNLVAHFPGLDPTGQTVMVQGHADVVAVGVDWTADPFGGDLIDGRIYGRGAVDMKGGVASALGAIAALRDAGVPLKEDLLVASVADEEAGGMGTLALVDRGYVAPGGAIVPEATSMNIAPLCRGILWGRVTLYGRAGHIELKQAHWKDGGAVDAIDYGRRLLNAIQDLNRSWAADPAKNHPLIPIPCQVNVAQIDGGEYPTTFAPTCTLTFDAQYLPHEKDDHALGSRVKAELEEFFAGFAGDDEWVRAHPPLVEWLIDADCGETPVEAPVVTALVRASREVGLPATLEGLMAHADMGLMIDAGTPTVDFGPGSMALAHQPDENLKVEDLMTAAKVMALAIAELCGA